MGVFADARSARYLYVAFAMFQCFLGAGVVFGWTSLLPVLEKEKIYHEYCTDEENVCMAQSEQLHFAFTIGGSASMTSNLLLGLVFDKFGPRKTKALSLALLITGVLLMSRAHYRGDEEEWSTDLLLPGMTLLGFAGPGIQLSGIHISNLFPEAKALVTCLIVGALQLSFLIFTIVAWVYDYFGVSKTAIFEGYAVVLLITLIGSLLTDPDTPFKESEDPENLLTDHELLSPMRLPTAFHDEDVPLLVSTPELNKYRRRRRSSHAIRAMLFPDGDLRTRSFRTQVQSTPFLLLVAYFSIQSVWCNYFLGSVTAQLRWKGLPESQVTSLLDDLAIVLPSSVVFIPIVGYLLETCGYTYSTLMCSAAALVFTVLLWSSTPGVLVAAFVMYTFFRTIMFPLLFAYIGHTFGFAHFGALSGTAFCIGGVVGLLQTPIAMIENFQTVGYLQFGSLALTLILPLYEHERAKRNK